MYWKDENKEKEAGDGPFLKLSRNDFIAGILPYKQNLHHIQLKIILFKNIMPKPGLFLFIFVFSHDKHSANLTINEK